MIKIEGKMEREREEKKNPGKSGIKKGKKDLIEGVYEYGRRGRSKRKGGGEGKGWRGRR